MRTYLAGLARGLRADLEPGGARHEEFARHARDIADTFGLQRGLPFHQDSVAGFLLGFRTATSLLPTVWDPRGLVAVHGGALLVARGLPVSDGQPREGRPFVARLLAALPPETTYEQGFEKMVGTVQDAFGLAGGVPLTCATLGGFSLGAIEANRFLIDGADPTPMVAAACSVGLQLG